MILKEYFPLQFTPEQITESVGLNGNTDALVIKKVLLQRANAKNRNGRFYPKDILLRETQQYNDNFVKIRRAIGELDHTDKMVVELKNASHLITELWWEGDDVYGNVEILDSPEFPSGRIAAGLIRKKIPVGISSRAQGSLTQTNEGSVVNSDLKLLCWDLVSYESTIGSNFGLNEGAEFVPEKNFTKIDSIIHEIICNNSNACTCSL